MLRNGWESEPDYQGDFGKMGGHVAISVNENQNDPPSCMDIPPVRWCLGGLPQLFGK